MTRPTVRHVAIIGGGASGSLMAIHLLRRAGSSRLKITLVERSAELGRGVAYGSAHPYHLLNVRSRNMSAYSGDPDHFVNWLKREAPEARRDVETRFVPRLTFGRYLSQELAAARANAQARATLTVVTAEATDLAIRDGKVSIEIDGRSPVSADACVIATGNELPPTDDKLWSGDVWKSSDRQDLKAPGPVLFLGTGLSMIDGVQALLAAGFQGPMIAISRRGLLPQAHGAADTNRTSVAPPAAAGLVAMWRWVRNRARDVAAAGGDWRQVIDDLRPHTHDIWRRLPAADRERFLRHARPWWDTHRHRMAPEVAAKVDGLIAQDRLLLIPGKIMSTDPSPLAQGGVNVRFRRRGHQTVSSLYASKVIDCRGVVADVGVSTNPVIAALLRRGLACPHPLRLGFEVGENFALLDREGRPSPQLFAIGPLTRGVFWESIAVPDIRVQCERLAEEFTQRVREEPSGWFWRGSAPWRE